MATCLDDITALLALEEGEHVEFKRGALGAKELAEYAVGIGNSGGGLIVLGVTDEQPRAVYGLSDDAVAAVLRARRNVLDSADIRVEVEARQVGEKRIVVVQVPPRPRGRLFHTRDGKYLTREGEHLRGMTEAEIAAILRAEAGQLDILAETAPGSWEEHVSLVEVERLRALLRQHHREELGAMEPAALLRNLELLRDHKGAARITRAGVLLVGTAEAIRTLVPTHEVKLLRFGPDPLVPVLHEDLRVSIPQIVERAAGLLAPVNTVESFQSGLFRVDLPRFPELAWRESLANALAHRDYGAFGSIAIRVYEDRLEVGSPGGFFGGVTETNLLTTESRRRNELLAQTLQRVGLAERSAVGIKRMYRAMLLGGKPPPAYRSTEGSVTVDLSAKTVDRGFRALVEGPWGTDPSFSVPDLLVLSLLRRERTIRSEDAARVTQAGVASANELLQALAARQLVERRGIGRGRRWVLGAEAYRRLGIEHERPLDLGMEEQTFEGLLLDELRRRGKEGLQPADMRKWSQYGKAQTTRILARLQEDGRIVGTGKRGRGARYWLPSFAPERDGEDR